MPDELERGRAIFLDEARELVDELETALLGLEDAPDDKELVGRVFRAMHTLKGSGAMFGFDDVAAFTHEVETCFDMVRSGRLCVTKGLIDLTLGSLDQVRLMLEGAGQASLETAQGLVAAFRDVCAGASGSEDAALPDGKAAGTACLPCRPAPYPGGGEPATYDIRFRPQPGIMLNGTNPLALISELRAMGDCNVVAHTEQLPPLGEMDPEACYTWWDMTLTTARGIDEIKDVFIFVEGDCELSVCRLGEGGQDDGRALLGEILVEKGDVTPEVVEEALRRKKRLGEILVDMGKLTPAERDEALAEQRTRERASAEQAGMASIRVASERLDVLADLVGELVTAQARLSRLSAVLGDPELQNITEQVEKLAEMLRDNTLGMRMVPFGTTFTKFKRLVRDLSRDLGKDAALESSGGETELDKTVIERLSDPVLHIIRNCIDHGIEGPEERGAAGKPRQGVVRLSASHSGGNVYISISDDGRGLDAELIRQVAVDKGLVGPEERPADGFLFELAMTPGFSTAKSVSSVSGRGVGLDVVKRRMDSLRGRVDIVSAKGSGTTITLKLPLTLAIIDGLLVQVSDSFFVLPLGSVRECVERAGTGANERQFVDIRGELVPAIPLRSVFGIPGGVPALEHLVIVDEGGQKVAVAVDTVVGEHQTVIKPLSRAFRGVEGVSGATVLGDGRLALILDLPGLISCAMKEEADWLRAA
ncbi:MAG: chemotaxis protein CheA [Nitrospirae bacterium]|nr:chemotaxis protein CheA [Nitrospirota bacterium]MBI5696807.1 chemotaxis protein CheA [Nitrospirota bacterium]